MILILSLHLLSKKKKKNPELLEVCGGALTHDTGTLNLELEINFLEATRSRKLFFSFLLKHRCVGHFVHCVSMHTLNFMDAVKLKWVECHFGQEATFLDLRLQILLLLMATGVFSGKYFVNTMRGTVLLPHLATSTQEQLGR